MTDSGSDNLTDDSGHNPDTAQSGYVGRFAPSPSGPLHLGSMLAALASFLDARASNGRWLLRIDDIDTPRNVDGAETAILRCLEAHGLHWDGPIVRQSTQLSRYADALASLASDNRLFWCSCSRRSIGPNAYPGTCREFTSPRADCAIRLRTPSGEITWQDRARGPATENVEQTVGDYVLQRRDGIFSYQLCVVVDDADSGVTHIVRGDDLRATTARQVQLCSLLGSPVPSYLHIPTINSRNGHKLSKQTFAPGVDTTRASLTLTMLMQLLGLATPTDAVHMAPADLLAIAAENWRQRVLAGKVEVAPSNGFVGL